MAERIVVSGAGGFIGSHVVRRLVANGSDVVALVRPESDLWRLHDVVDAVELARADLREVAVPGSVDAVLHLAAAGVHPEGGAREIIETNVLGTLAALELARRAGAGRFLYCGSCFEYGPGEQHAESAVPRPISEYGASKAAGWLLAEAFSRAHELPVVSVRPFTIYGRYEAAHRLVSSVCLSIVRGEAVELTTGSQTRDFVFIDDAVDAILLAARSGIAGTFNICSGVSTSVRDLAEQAVALSGREVELRPGTIPSRAVEFATLSGDPSHTADELGWGVTTTLDEGLRGSLEWFAEHADEYAAYDRREVRA